MTIQISLILVASYIICVIIAPWMLHVNCMCASSDIAKGGNERPSLGLLAVLSLLAIGALLFLLILVVMLFEVILSLCLVGTIDGKVSRIATLETIVVLPSVPSILIEAHELIGDQRDLLITQIVHPLLSDRQQSRQSKNTIGKVLIKEEETTPDMRAIIWGSEVGLLSLALDYMSISVDLSQLT